MQTSTTNPAPPPAMPTPSQLLQEAIDLETAWAARGGPPLLARETAVADIPIAPGRTLVITRKADGRRMPQIRFRIWRTRPDGRREPLTGMGFSVEADVLPLLAGALARALAVELAEIARDSDEDRHPLEAARLREAFLGAPRGSRRGWSPEGQQGASVAGELPKWADDAGGTP